MERDIKLNGNLINLKMRLLTPVPAFSTIINIFSQFKSSSESNGIELYDTVACTVMFASNSSLPYYNWEIEDYYGP